MSAGQFGRRKQRERIERMQSEGRPQGEISGRNPNEFVLFAFFLYKKCHF